MSMVYMQSENEIKEEYDPDDDCFFCKLYQGWIRSLGCKWRAQVRLNNGECSPKCKQAIEERVFRTRIRRREKK